MDDLDSVIAETNPPPAPAIPAVPLIKDAKRGSKEKRVRRGKSTEEIYADHLPKTAEEAMKAIWHKPKEIRAHERLLFKKFMSKVRRKEVPGLGKDHSPLANCYAWTQSKGYVIFVVWLQGPLDDVTVEVTEPAHVLVQTEGFPAVVDRDLAYGIDPSQDMDSVSWDKLDMIAFKIAKAEYGKRWDRLFDGDWRMLRAADFGGKKGCYDWEPNPDPEEHLSFVITVYVPEHTAKKDVTVEIKSDCARVAVAGWPAEWRRSFKFNCRSHQSTWQLAWRAPAGASFEPAWSIAGAAAEVERGSPEDMRFRRRRAVQLTCYFTELPMKRMVYDRDAAGEIHELGKIEDVKDPPKSAFAADVPDKETASRVLFVEEEDGMLTGVNMLRYLPPQERDQYAFDETDEQSDPESVIQWWDRTAYDEEVEWCRSLGREPRRFLTDDPDGDLAARSRRLGLDDDDDDDDDEDDDPVVEVYLSLGKHLALADDAVFVFFGYDHLRVEALHAPSKSRAVFSVDLAHDVDAEKCKFKVKADRGDVVLTLRKFNADDVWAKLNKDVNFDTGDQGVGAPAEPADNDFDGMD
ncbi:hypothetical protein JL722_5649 [Aureococcus anophagefferens]|nr:hypothetical protein JL722_5649 [Aureococcus anophagefferens]